MTQPVKTRITVASTVTRSNQQLALELRNLCLEGKRLKKAHSTWLPCWSSSSPLPPISTSLPDQNPKPSRSIPPWKRQLLLPCSHDPRTSPQSSDAFSSPAFARWLTSLRPLTSRLRSAGTAHSYRPRSLTYPSASWMHPPPAPFPLRSSAPPSAAASLSSKPPPPS